MRCAVITPVGPGHERLFEECRISVHNAIQHSKGPFREIFPIVIEDTSGEKGRAAARNEAVAIAKSADIEWLFFLDADDLMYPNAFEVIKQYVHDYDAIWGSIVEMNAGSHQSMLRIPQILTIHDIREILLFDPYITIQMGHFVRTVVAGNNPFNEAMNTGEDFDYYLRVWSTAQCVKIRAPLFINRRGLHSVGPRSADGAQWRQAVEEQIEEYRKKYGIQELNLESIQIINKKTLEFIHVARSYGIANHDSYFQLSRILPYYGYHAVDCYECPEFLMLSNNDDLVINSIMWTGSYEASSLSIWARLSSEVHVILDIGAYTGIYGFVAARRNPQCRIICFEPLGINFLRIRENISLNAFNNITVLPMAVSDRDGEIDLHVYSSGNYLTSGSSIKHDTTKHTVVRKRVQSISIDKFVQLNAIQRIDIVKIDVEGSVREVLTGMKKTVSTYKPDFIIEVLHDIELARHLTEYFRSLGYNFFEIREDQKDIKQTTAVTSGTSLLDLNRFITTKSKWELQELFDRYGSASRKINVLGLS